MPEIRTIFLADDGRHTTLGRGDAVELPDEVAETIRAARVQGWVAIASGDYFGAGAMHVARVHAVIPTRDELWTAAVERFNDARDRARRS